MTKEYLIIGDIAGRANELEKLIKLAPPSAIPVSVGDMCDRGKQSKEVYDFFMKTPGALAIMGNHDHMLLDFYRYGRYYDPGIWFYNGGSATVDSFGGKVPAEYLNFIGRLPKYLELYEDEEQQTLISHAFLNPVYETVEESIDLGTHALSDKGDQSIIWSRYEPKRRDKYKLQVAGHNSHLGLYHFTDQFGIYAIGIDTSREEVLTGLLLPSMGVLQVPYDDIK